MTDKQIERIKKSIRKRRAALTAEKRKFGGFIDSAGNRYYIFELYMKIVDYKGVITYKKWFDKNFSDDIGSPFLSLIWAVACFELGKMAEAKTYTIDTAFQNVYLHGLLLDREVSPIDMYNHGYDMLEFAKSLIEDCKKITTKTYLDWLATFINTDEYNDPVNKYIALNKLLKDENNDEKRGKLLDEIELLEKSNKAQS
ncbi:hypothetical protein [Thermophagus xiamenensis]|uniref:Uncharacterized protein n=1 Tax=Thermophagus xiamenensis TaxID=385682 RepID=A0A1I1VS74_9BACT|nr:hypothetical protein [Thermophagus xiamenensis]SFD85897.1 hypothetical protein SAMN05444380_10345 [Thermophagus xiamenensis]